MVPLKQSNTQSSISLEILKRWPSNLAPEMYIVKETKRDPLCRCHDNGYAAACVLIKTKILRFYLKQRLSPLNNLMGRVKAGVNPKAVFWLGIMFLMQISRLRFKQSRISMLISHIYVLGCFVNFLVIFRYIWREIVFLKGLVKLMEIGNFEDLLLF